MSTSGLARHLVKDGYLSESECQLIARDHANTGAAFAKVVIALGLFSEEKLAEYLATKAKCQMIPQGQICIVTDSAESALGLELIQALEVIPLVLEGKVLSVAMADPLDQNTLQQLAFFTKYRIRPVVATFTSIYNSLANLVQGFTPTETTLQKFLSHRTLKNQPYEEIAEELDTQVGESVIGEPDLENESVEPEPEKLEANEDLDDLSEGLDSFEDDFGDENKNNNDDEDFPGADSETESLDLDQEFGGAEDLPELDGLELDDSFGAPKEGEAELESEDELSDEEGALLDFSSEGLGEAESSLSSGSDENTTNKVSAKEKESNFEESVELDDGRGLEGIEGLDELGELGDFGESVVDEGVQAEVETDSGSSEGAGELEEGIEGLDDLGDIGESVVDGGTQAEVETDSGSSEGAGELEEGIEGLDDLGDFGESVVDEGVQAEVETDSGSSEGAGELEEGIGGLDDLGDFGESVVDEGAQAEVETDSGSSEVVGELEEGIEGLDDLGDFGESVVDEGAQAEVETDSGSSEGVGELEEGIEGLDDLGDIGESVVDEGLQAEVETDSGSSEGAGELEEGIEGLDDLGDIGESVVDGGTQAELETDSGSSEGAGELEEGIEGLDDLGDFGESVVDEGLQAEVETDSGSSEGVGELEEGIAGLDDLRMDEEPNESLTINLEEESQIQIDSDTSLDSSGLLEKIEDLDDIESSTSIPKEDSEIDLDSVSSDENSMMTSEEINERVSLGNEAKDESNLLGRTERLKAEDQGELNSFNSNNHIDQSLASEGNEVHGADNTTEEILCLDKLGELSNNSEESLSVNIASTNQPREITKNQQKSSPKLKEKIIKTVSLINQSITKIGLAISMQAVEKIVHEPLLKSGLSSGRLYNIKGKQLSLLSHWGDEFIDQSQSNFLNDESKVANLEKGQWYDASNILNIDSVKDLKLSCLISDHQQCLFAVVVWDSELIGHKQTEILSAKLLTLLARKLVK